MRAGPAVHCIGAPLARLECKAVLDVLLNRLSGFSATDTEVHDARSSFAPKRLPLDVTWRP
ncbi:hypothetical protein [Streptomyces sp. NPDC050560]|uniref:hypothetical protein n=1 Tax=Streptomyces sp. NPDC050560 TaxID=3365630 RepID=UPI00378C138F